MKIEGAKSMGKRENLLVLFTTAMLVLMAIIPSTTPEAWGQEPLHIGGRLEMFVDDYLVDELDTINRIMHSPERCNYVTMEYILQQSDFSRLPSESRMILMANRS